MERLLFSFKNNHKKIRENVTNINAMFYGNYELYKYYKSTTHSHFLKFLDTTMDNGCVVMEENYQVDV